jgi:pimeloyl-ACP methyl ester carboxylesterase
MISCLPDQTLRALTGPSGATTCRSGWPAVQTCRPLLLAGSADRIAFMHARVVALLPRAQAVWLEGATDFVAEQSPALFAGHLIDFMATHAEGLTPGAGARTL